MKLENKTIIITGACGLIGREFVNACLLEGAQVILSDISKDAGEKALLEINHPSAFFVQTDITSDKSVDELINTVSKKCEKIDAVINNAYPRNKNYGNKLEEVSMESFNENVSMHLGGFYLCMKKFAEFFKKQGHGNVISMGSIYGIMAPRFEIYDGTPMTMPVEYAAIKSAVIHLTKYFAEYFKKDNIRFNAISPGGIFNHQPEDFVKRYSEYAPMLQKSDLNATLIYLLSDESEKVNGENFVVDNGFSGK